MSISAKQLAANRRNAKKSTGPKTPEGKAISARNATKHGAYAKNVTRTIKHLKQPTDEYRLIKRSLEKAMQPRTKSQKKLVKLLTDTLWRIKQVKTVKEQNVKQLLINFKPTNGKYIDRLVTALEEKDNLSLYESKLNARLNRIQTLYNYLQEK